MSGAAYDRIGVGYRRVRQPEPRIAARIETALGGARTVLNVGAGSGSYEPDTRDVMAVEPSQAMIDQRPPGAAPVVRANAEALPFDDGGLRRRDGPDHGPPLARPAAGLAELARVARERVLVLSFDPAPLAGLWLREYFPRAIEIHEQAMAPVAALAEMLGGAVTVEPIPIPRDCADGFFLALWDRPELHLDPEVRRASSVWHAMAPGEIEPGLAALRADLASGVWDERHGHLRTAPELDVGLRLIAREQR